MAYGSRHGGLGGVSYSGDNVYISGLPENVTDKHIEHLFMMYGSIVSTKILQNPQTGAPLGTALVRMQNTHQAASAIQNLNGFQLMGGNVLSCRYANEKPRGLPSSTNLYVSGLSHNITDSALRELFAPYGSVTSQRIITNRATGMPLGTALVRMETNEQANACINNINGAQMSGGKYLSVRFATEKGICAYRSM
eukprot:CAMPEP_0185271698 /NCGR_PEP_ID=MMETSP1359-20130426/45433_1 /TAXON_ID=552665 /ORGANISM="Bigelowiella longifila, Strain CCMP242" /LENGTH=194 /DNA_ID=CAMNT_0027863735 /DNA_START=1 /DNA_END=585 /DNA_ORIENTATION=+